MPRGSILYFASAREASGTARESVRVEPGTTVSDVVEILLKSHPGLRPLQSSIRVALNQELVGPNEGLSDGDELALLPPVAGG